MGEKHVIFLGAGASHTSGYPLANGLRLLVSSKAHLANWLEAAGLPASDSKGTAHNLTSDYAQSIDFFRRGGFSSLDEFCKLARDSDKTPATEQMRNVIVTCLSIKNPEDKFEESDYYPFVQALFKDDLRTLREDIAVLSYNYDPYLDYLLYRAVECRVGLSPGGIVMPTALLNSVTGGYYDDSNLDWLVKAGKPDSFCLLKLHGSICYVTPKTRLNHHVLFDGTVNERIRRIFDSRNNVPRPPVLFPWDVIRSDGQFVPESEFKHHNALPYKLCQGTWQRARHEINAATKVSFVGLSMHQLMEDGLKFLFQQKVGEVRVVVANSDNKLERPISANNPPAPDSACGRVDEVLKRVRHPSLKWSLTSRASFTEFIEREMAT